MGITRLNHAVLYVSDLGRSVAFYRDVLGFDHVAMTPEGFSGAAFLRAEDSTNDHDLGLFEVGRATRRSAAGGGGVGLYHLAWEVDTLDTLDRVRARLDAVGALVGMSDHGTTKSLYGRDPDGLEFEVVWLIPASLLDAAALAGRTTIGRLDLEATKARYGARTLGGVGISIPS